MNARFLPFAWALFICAPAVFAQDYAIRLLRPLKAGDEYKIAATAKQTQILSMTVDGVPQKDGRQEKQIQFEGVEKVVEVDVNGKETKILLTVENFATTVNGTTREIEPKGTIINSSVVDKTDAHDINGKTVDPQVAEALDMVVSLSHGGPTEDEILGTKERKKKGDSWDVNGDKASAAMENSADGGKINNVTGKTTLADVTNDALKITAHTSGNLTPPLSSAFVVDQSSVETTFAVTLPIDPARHETEDSQTISFSLSAHTDNEKDGKTTLKSTLQQTISRTMTPVK